MQVSKEGNKMTIEFSDRENMILSNRITLMLYSLGKNVNKDAIKNVLEEVYENYPKDLGDDIDRLLNVTDYNNIPTDLADTFIAANVFTVINEAVFGRRRRRDEY
jgi:hypothetical protein